MACTWSPVGFITTSSVLPWSNAPGSTALGGSGASCPSEARIPPTAETSRLDATTRPTFASTFVDTVAYPRR